MAMPRFSHIAMFGVGTDHIDIHAATEHGILVTRALGGNSRSVAELALAFIFALARRLVPIHNDMTAAIWKRQRSTQLYGKNLGIIGLGAIGSELARMGSALGMQVLACQRNSTDATATSLGYTVLPLPQLLAQSDYVALCVPGQGEAPLIGARELALMQGHACILNISRGSVLDLNALTQAVREKKLAGAALDVYPQEPMDPAHPVFSTPNILHSPHVGANTNEAIDAVFELCLQDAVLWRKGKPSPRAVNPEVYALHRAPGI